MQHVAALVALAASLGYQASVWLLLAEGYVARSVFMASPTMRILVGILTLALLVWVVLQRERPRGLALLVVGALGLLALLRGVLGAMLPRSLDGWFFLHTISWWLGVLAAGAALVLWFRARPQEA